MSKERVLVVAAHADDESFGCLGSLLQHKEAGDEVNFCWIGMGRNSYQGAQQCQQYFDGSYTMNFLYEDQRYDTYPLQNFITIIEYNLKKFVPTIVYTNFIGDLNRDHRIISEATMVACRPYKKYAPREVLMYEIPGTTELGLREFRKDKLVKIDKKMKESLIKEWYPGEMINGREKIDDAEHFEKWPRK